MPSQRRYADRPPRIQPELVQGQIEIPPPPTNKGRGLSIAQAILPLTTIGGYILISLLGQGRNILFILPMGLAVVLSTGLTVTQYFRNQRDHRRATAEYLQLLSEMRRDMVGSHDAQRSFYRYNYPDVPTVLRVDGSTADSRSGSRLWERRSWDEDFGMVRLGEGARPSSVIYTVKEADDEVGPLFREAQKLDEDSRIVHDVPILVPLYKHPATNASDETDEVPVRHMVGVTGEPDVVYAFLRAMLTHTVAFHAPTDLNLALVGVSGAARHWAWLADSEGEPLPHFAFPRSKHDRNFFPLRFENAGGRPDPDDREKDPVARFWKLLQAELDRRALRLQDDAASRGSVSLPFLLTIVDMMESIEDEQDWPRNSMLQEVESEAAVALVSSRGQDIGVATLFLVPDRRKVPSACTAVIEVERTSRRAGRIDFRYAEVGVNTPRYVGTADALEVEHIRHLSGFVNALNTWLVRRSYGADIPLSVTLLQMMRSETIEGLDIESHWARSYAAEDEADWLRSPLGIMSNQEKRTLYMAADGDGVHGMIAGSTGSGKSELLMTFILSLAINYDPRILNFVLIDYKGGQAFEPFRNLPHCVDIVTNLQGSAVERMFKAINAELNRRQALNTATQSAHIVKFRKKALHKGEVRLGGKVQRFPHLIVIIDEFAEMIAGNAEYKEQLNSITRLGRALGVNLLLAAQRPTGVTDQMRANIKFRICLRVETREESSEMLRRPDAAYLPPGVPGRGYLQIGNENIELMQVAYAGADYEGYEMDGASAAPTTPADDWDAEAEKDVIWLERRHKRAEPPKLFEVLVQEMHRISQQTMAPQQKPWPNPLPSYYDLAAPVPEDAGYLDATDAARHARRHTDDHGRLRLNLPMTLLVDQLRADGPASAVPGLWPGVDWRIAEDPVDDGNAMRPVIGVIDDPARAQQRLLRLNFMRGHAVIFGAGGWGKTTFLRSIITSIASTHSPQEAHIYIMDFGGRNLEVFKDLPHVGAIIRPDEEERVRRLMRHLRNTLNERKRLFSEASATNFVTYNVGAASDEARHPLPAVLVVIDNYAEFRENFEILIPTLGSLVRDGAAGGVYFVVTGESTQIVGKLYGLLMERYTLKLTDSSEYSAIVGRGVPPLGDVPGRGYVAVDRSPLEFHVALPIGLTDAERKERGNDETKKLRLLVQLLNTLWAEGWATNTRGEPIKALVPASISELDEYVSLERVVDDYRTVLGDERLPIPPVALLGIEDTNLDIGLLDRLASMPHFVITGQQQTGKTTALRAIILSLALFYTPQQLGMVFLDRQGTLFNHLGERTLADIPHVLHDPATGALAAITEPDEYAQLLLHLEHEYVTVPASEAPQRRLFIFIDNYDDFKELSKDLAVLAAYTRVRSDGRMPVHFFVCGSAISMRTPDDLVRRIARYGLAMDAASVEQSPFNARLQRSLREAELPLGRGFIIHSGRANVVQIASPQPLDNAGDPQPLPDSMDAWIAEVLARHGTTHAAWLPLPDTQPQEQIGASKPVFGEGYDAAAAEDLLKTFSTKTDLPDWMSAPTPDPAPAPAETEPETTPEPEGGDD